MNIIYNGKNTICNDCKLSQFLLIQNINYETEGVAVALNKTLIPKNLWYKTVLKENDNIDVISPFQGG